MDDVFLHTKPARILVGIHQGDDPKYASVLSREAECTYAHTVKILNTFEENDLVEFDKQGRKKLIELTDRGQQVAQHMTALMNTLDEVSS